MAEQGDTTGSETSFECPAHKDDGTVSSISGSTLYKAIKVRDFSSFTVDHAQSSLWDERSFCFTFGVASPSSIS